MILCERNDMNAPLGEEGCTNRLRTMTTIIPYACFLLFSFGLVVCPDVHRYI